MQSPSSGVKPHPHAPDQNSTEKMGILLALPVDYAAIRIWSVALGASRRRLAGAIHDSMALDTSSDIAPEAARDELFKRAANYGKQLVRLTSAREHYTRYRHNDGALFNPRQQSTHRFAVATTATQALAEQLGYDTTDTQSGKAIIDAAHDVARMEGYPAASEHQVAGLITLLALERLHQESEGNGN